MAKYYAWTMFPRSDQHPSEHIKVGDEVSRDSFGDIDDADFEELLRIGAIRKQPYPIPQRDDGSFEYEGSPREFALQQAADMAEGVYADVDNTWRVPQLQERAEEALEAAEDYDPGSSATVLEGDNKDTDAAREADAAEKEQGTRKALEGRGLTPGSVARRTGNKPQQQPKQ